MDYNLELRQRQSLSQTQIQSLELMNMNNLELNTWLNNEYLENPLIEQTGGGDTPGVTQEFGDWYGQNQMFNEGYGHGDRDEERHREAVPADKGESIENYLKEQLDRNRYSQEEWRVIEFLIKNLDDSGFYSTSVEETARLAETTAETVETCLEDLRQLEPFGIFAENLSGCLLRQIELTGAEDPVLTEIVRNHLGDIAGGKISAITRSLGISSAQARKYIAYIKTLNPRPLSGFSLGDTGYIIPDILFLKKGDEWEIVLNDDWMGKYQLNQYYMKMTIESRDPELKEYFRKKLERARFILSSIEQRRKTILSVSGAILEHQKEFFEGKGDLKPLTMAELAESLGIHPATVSRAASGKYIQYPGGVVLMKELFPQGVGGDQGSDNMTAGQIKKLIRELIDGEDKGNPYSDNKLSQELKKRGVVLSRRGVAKYREEMGIQGSFERRIY